jgi:hypothetical protein
MQYTVNGNQVVQNLGRGETNIVATCHNSVWAEAMARLLQADYDKGTERETTTQCGVCKHYGHGEKRCRTCGCSEGESNGVVVHDQSMVKLEGHDLDVFLKHVQRKGIRYFRLSWYGDHVTLKVNEGSWTHALGQMQPPY